MAVIAASNMAFTMLPHFELSAPRKPKLSQVSHYFNLSPVKIREEVGEMS